MKVGDIYYCIKDVYNKDKKIINISNKKYKILEIREKYNRVIIETESRFLKYFFCIINDNKSWLFNEYFVSLQDYRKMKLEKLNKL